jgi:hypothetical protein
VRAELTVAVAVALIVLCCVTLAGTPAALLAFSSNMLLLSVPARAAHSSSQLLVSLGIGLLAQASCCTSASCGTHRRMVAAAAQGA